jgi:hypothetical protein
MFANDEYTFEVDAVVNGVHNEVVNNRATIYTPTETGDVIEEITQYEEIQIMMALMKILITTKTR